MKEMDYSVPGASMRTFWLSAQEVELGTAHYQHP